MFNILASYTRHDADKMLRTAQFDPGQFELTGDLAEDLQSFYEREWKYSVLKRSPFSGVPKRRENIIARVEGLMRGLIKAIAEEMLPTFEYWLMNHAITDPRSWAEIRVLDLEGEGFSNLLDVMEGEYNRYTGAHENIYAATMNTLRANKEKFPVLSAWLSDVYKEDKMAWEGDPEDETDEYPYDTFDEWLDSGAADEYFDMLVADADVTTSSADMSGIAIEMYANLVFPVWFDKWEAEGIVETRNRIQEHHDNIEALSYGDISNTGNAIAEISAALNSAHQTVSMLEYLNEQARGGGDLETVLDELTSGGVQSSWNNNLQKFREMGFDVQI